MKAGADKCLLFSLRGLRQPSRDIIWQGKSAGQIRRNELKFFKKSLYIRLNLTYIY